MEYINDICEIGEKAGKMLGEINRNEEIKVSDAPVIKDLLGVVEKSMNIDRMANNDGYSQDGGYDGGESYGNGSSYANRGKHYVRGHYSRDGGTDGYSSRRRDSRGRYSRDDGRSEMMEHLEMAIESADDKDRETIKRFMRQLENA